MSARVSTRRQRALFGLSTIVAAGAMVIFVAAALGTTPAPNGIGDPSAFEAADGNMTNETAGGLDWNCLTTPPVTAGSTASCGANDGSYVHSQDLAAGTSANLSWKSGQKQNTACPILTGSSNPAKDTFTDIASYNDVGLSSITNKIDTFLYGSTIRSTANGTANENIELQQGTSGTCAGEPAGVTVFQRTAGDKLITIDYTNGGATATFGVLTWLTSGAGTACFSGTTLPCWGNQQSLSANAAEGEANLNPIAAANNGIQAGDSGGAQSLVAAQFAEFGIDLPAAGVVSQTACTGFAQTLWESRSSASFTSNPEDIEIEGHSFSTCQPATINVVKIDSSTGKAIQGAVFDLFAGSPASGPSLGRCTTDVNGDCTLGPVTGTGTSTYTVHETTAPNGYGPGADQTCTITFTQTAQNPACTLTFKDKPALGTINIAKTDTAGNPLGGAVFTLYTDNGNTVTGGDSPTAPDSDDTIAPSTAATSVTCTTGSSGATAGACSFQNVALGTYTVFETTTPAGYETAPAQPVTIGLGSAPGTGQTVGLTFVDPFAPATIDVQKQDNSGNPVNGAVFSLYAGSTATGTPLATCTSGQPSGQSTGDCTLGSVNISQGSTFTIAETTAPNGYTGASPQTFTVNWTNATQTITKTFADTPVPGTIVVQKSDSAGKALNGAVFGLYTDNGNTVAGGDSPINPDGDDTAVASGGSPVTCTTGASSAGACSFTNVPLGSYVVFETATPAGYQTAPAQTVTIGLGGAPGTGQTKTLTFTDPYAPATINIIKQDSSGAPLNGAVFSLYAGSSATGTPLATCTSGQTGSSAGDCSLGNVNITQGTTFTIAETTAPNGYAAGSPQTITVVWTNSPQTIPVTFTDTPVPGTINVQKNDSANKPLNGAVFGLYTNNGNTVTGGDSPINPDGDDTAVTSGGSPVTCTTGASSAGACSFTNVPLGSYVVFETATPAGYQTAPAQTVTIGLGGAPGTGQTKSLTFTDPFAPATINIIKQDTSGNPVNGAVFSLYAGSSATGTPLATCTSGQTGSSAGDCSLGSVNVTQGTTFTIAETTVPNGYTGGAPQTITVVWTNSPQTIPVTFTDAPVPGTINIQKLDDASPPNALSGATFTLYKESGTEPSGDSATAPDADDTAVTGSPTTITCTTAGGVCSLQNVPLGSYTVFETTTPPDYQTAPAQDVTISLGGAANVGDTENLTFTDPRLHKEIVLVCSEGTNTLDSSSVTIDGGTTQQSLDTGASLPSGVTEASLCGLGGATKSDLPDGASSTAQIAIH